MKNETFYFSHDYNARNDFKIKKLISKLGYQGYGLYWAIIEDLYNNENKLPADYDMIGYDFRVDSNIIYSLINDFDLFRIDKLEFSSTSVQSRLDMRNVRSLKAKANAEKRWGNANEMQVHSKGNAIKEIKGKEIKGKEKKLNINNDIEIKFNTMPKHDEIGSIPEIVVLNAIQLLKIAKGIIISKDKVECLWHVFKQSNVNGDTYYATETKIHRHFINWIKNQPLNDDSNKPKNEQRFDARLEYANRYNQEGKSDN